MLSSVSVDIAAQLAELRCKNNSGGGWFDDMARRRGEKSER